MYYKVVEHFGPESGAKWHDYLKWIGLPLKRFDSVDAIMRPDLFSPETEQDWANCVNEDFKLKLITNLDYARRILEKHDNAEVVGVEIDVDESHVPGSNFLGYDIIDKYCDVSLITNWGSDQYGKYPFDRQVIEPNGLISSIEEAILVRDQLRNTPSPDAHSRNCTIWAVYRLGQ